MSYVAEEARALGLRLQSRRWDDPAHTIDTMDSAIAELAAMRKVAVDWRIWRRCKRCSLN